MIRGIGDIFIGKSIRFVRTKLLPIYNKFKKAKSNKYYDTINRNCLHATCAALVKGTFNQKGIDKLISFAKSFRAPNLASSYLFYNLRYIGYKFYWE